MQWLIYFIQQTNKWLSHNICGLPYSPPHTTRTVVRTVTIRRTVLPAHLCVLSLQIKEKNYNTGVNIQIPSNIFHMQTTLEISLSTCPEVDPGGHASLSLKSAAVSMLGMQVKILLRVWNFVSCVVLNCAVGDLCEGTIPRSGDSLRLLLPNWVWSRNLRNEAV